MIGQNEIWEYLIYKFIASLFSLNIFICHKQDKMIGHKLYHLCCRLRYFHDIHTLTYTELNYI
jgi:hypothetical protein